jgi:hypothetical protein
MINFATPCYRSDPKKAVDWSVLRMKEMGALGTVSLEYGCPNVHVARAKLVSSFRLTKCHSLFFRDDDIDVSAATIKRMVDLDAPAVIAPYKLRHKKERFDVIFNESGDAVWAGLGCALLRRDVIETLWNLHYEEKHFFEDDFDPPVVNLFRDEQAYVNGTRRLLKEDHAFWFRVREAGFPITVLDEVTVNHAGITSYYQRDNKLQLPSCPKTTLNGP